MKTSRVPLTALAALLTLTIAGMSASALADTTPIQTDIGMHNDDNNCSFTITPPANKLFSATFTSNIANETRSMVADTVGPATISVDLNGAATCAFSKVKIGLASTTTAYQSGYNGYALLTANGGKFPVTIFLSRPISYTDNGRVNTVATEGSKYTFSPDDGILYPAGSEVPTGAGGTTTNAYTQYDPRPTFVVTANVYHGRGSYLSNGRFTSNDILAHSSDNKLNIITCTALTQSDENLRAMDLELGAAFGTRPYGAGNTPDDETVFDNETITAQTVIEVTPS